MEKRLDRNKMTNNVIKAFNESEKKQLTTSEIIRLLHKKYVYYNHPILKKHLDILADKNILTKEVSLSNNAVGYTLCQ